MLEGAAEDLRGCSSTPLATPLRSRKSAEPLLEEVRGLVADLLRHAEVPLLLAGAHLHLNLCVVALHVEVLALVLEELAPAAAVTVVRALVVSGDAPVVGPEMIPVWLSDFEIRSLL
ncbi:hypothetical protein AVEN_261325-1 [Araneus ventricosus]|uniref:Uncharacterized protein n=1 Tax=Araneus ventricosus TaxID=182803 RepID=A0A4Y2Q9A7_ARAVE|nr:hypothetical protein AVEN_261325-1 [Araneus ventricosus]